MAQAVKDTEIAARRETVFRLLAAIEVVELTRPILPRASQPLPTMLDTLDAIHLATALFWKERTSGDLVMATHDEGLVTASRPSGLRVIGVSVSV